MSALNGYNSIKKSRIALKRTKYRREIEQNEELKSDETRDEERGKCMDPGGIKSKRRPSDLA